MPIHLEMALFVVVFDQKLDAIADKLKFLFIPQQGVKDDIEINFLVQCDSDLKV